MITIHENDWYYAIGFVPPSNDPTKEKMELLAHILRERKEDGELGPLQMIYRFRYHNPESVNPWDNKDKKSWYALQEKEDQVKEPLEERIKKIREAMQMLLLMTSIRNGVESCFIEVPDPKNGKAYIDILPNFPFMHIKTMTKEEHDNFIKEENS